MDPGMMFLNSVMGTAMQLNVAEVMHMEMESIHLAQAQLEHSLHRQVIEIASAQMPRMDPLVPGQPPLK